MTRRDRFELHRYADQCSECSSVPPPISRTSLQSSPQKPLPAEAEAQLSVKDHRPMGQLSLAV
ncbi:MAG: hypothetical protein AB7K04_12025 [Pseudorhodoplanes sp.]